MDPACSPMSSKRIVAKGEYVFHVTGDIEVGPVLILQIEVVLVRLWRLAHAPGSSFRRRCIQR